MAGWVGIAKKSDKHGWGVLSIIIFYLPPAATFWWQKIGKSHGCKHLFTDMKSENREQNKLALIRRSLLYFRKSSSISAHARHSISSDSILLLSDFQLPYPKMLKADRVTKLGWRNIIPSPSSSGAASW